MPPTAESEAEYAVPTVPEPSADVVTPSVVVEAETEGDRQFVPITAATVYV